VFAFAAFLLFQNEGSSGAEGLSRHACACPVLARRACWTAAWVAACALHTPRQGMVRTKPYRASRRTAHHIPQVLVPTVPTIFLTFDSQGSDVNTIVGTGFAPSSGGGGASAHASVRGMLASRGGGSGGEGAGGRPDSSGGVMGMGGAATAASGFTVSSLKLTASSSNSNAALSPAVSSSVASTTRPSDATAPTASSAAKVREAEVSDGGNGGLGGGGVAAGVGTTGAGVGVGGSAASASSASSSASSASSTAASSASMPGDGILIAESRTHPGAPVIFRTREAREANPERLDLDRRSLDQCCLLEGEHRLRLLNYQHNAIGSIQRLESVRSLVGPVHVDHRLTVAS